MNETGSITIKFASSCCIAKLGTGTISSALSAMTSKSKSKQEEALQFLDDLDSLNPAAQADAKSAPITTATGQPANEADAAEALAFLDEITQKSTEPTRTTTSHLDKPISRTSTPPSLRKSTERVKVGGGGAAPSFHSS